MSIQPSLLARAPQNIVDGADAVTGPLCETRTEGLWVSPVSRRQPLKVPIGFRNLEAEIARKMKHSNRADVGQLLQPAETGIALQLHELESAGFGSDFGLGGKASALDALEIESLAEE